MRKCKLKKYILYEHIYNWKIKFSACITIYNFTEIKLTIKIISVMFTWYVNSNQQILDSTTTQ